MRLNTAIAIFSVLIFGVFVALSVLLLKTADELDLEAQELAKASHSSTVAIELKTRLLTYNRNEFLYSLHKDPFRLAHRSVQRQEISKLLVWADQLVDNTKEADLLADVKRQINEFIKLRDRLHQLKLSPVEAYNRISYKVDEAIESIDQFVEFNRVQMDNLGVDIHSRNDLADRMAVWLLGAGGFIIFGLIIGVLVFVARPLAELTRVITSYKNGEQPTKSRYKGFREFKKIELSFNSMTEHLEEKRLDQFRILASIAHDLRTPLNSISLASEMLGSQGVGGDLSQIISRQVRNLDRIVGDLLDTSRIEAGQLELKVASQDIDSILRDCVDLYKTGNEWHVFKVETGDLKIYCECDGGRITQVMNNLISNAIKYSPGGGTVTVKAWREKNQVAISVADQGIAIAPEDLENIFTPFHRTRTTKDTIPGIGLGLSASRRIVEAHGGQLIVESVIHQGSKFIVTLPSQSGLHHPQT